MKVLGFVKIQQRKGKNNMKIRAVFFTLLLALLLLPAVGDAARLSDEEMELGGIRLGDTREEVEDIYGEGDHIADGVTKWGGTTIHIFACDYGDSLVVQYRDEGDACRVISVHLGVDDVNKYSHTPTEDACSIETPRGIHLDSTKEDLEEAYGYLPKPKCSNNAPPVCGYFYDGETAQLAFYICAEHSPGIRSIWLHEK